MSRYPLLAAAALVVTGACGPSTKTATAADRGAPALVDAPYEPASDRDLEDMRDRYEALDPGDPDRERLRGALAAEYARRGRAALARAGTRVVAYERLVDLVSLWTTQELEQASAAELAATFGPYADLARDIRKHFARTGGDIQATAALYVLAMADPDRRDEYLGEIDEIFAYADDQARAMYGDGAEHSRTIEILDAIVEEAPMPAAVDRLVELYLVRQERFHALFNQGGAAVPDLIQAHGSRVFKTAWHVVRVLARAGRIDRAGEVLAGIEGLGQSKALKKAVNEALGPGASARSWLDLAGLYSAVSKKETADEVNAKLRATLALCAEGARRFPDDPRLPKCVAGAARRLDRLHSAIRWYEEALARDPGRRDVAEPLAELYRVRVTTLAFYERPLAAKKRLAELEAFHARMAERWPDNPLESDLAEAYAAMGRGMTSLGELAAARQYLQKSLSLRPTMEALEQLGTIALKQERHERALEYFERALELPTPEPLDMYNRARILRLAGDAAKGAGQGDLANRRWGEAMESWMDLDKRLELPPAYQGELLVESGKVKWALGDPEIAMQAFDLAVDVDPDGADTHSSVISFLIVRGEYERALDTYHRALGSYAIDEYSKIYMSLWMLAEARRTGRQPDPLVVEFLASRKGRLWHHALARYASGQETLSALESRARTRGHRAELLYYSAVLDRGRTQRDIRARLERVVDTDMVLFYEYDMARYWLAEGFAPAARAAR